MGLFDRIITSQLSRLGFVKQADLPPMRTGGIAVVAGEAAGAQAGLTSDQSGRAERLAITTSWVYSDVGYLAQTISATPFGVLQAEDEEKPIPIENHPFEQVLRWPNSQDDTSLMDQVWLLEYTGWWYWLRGEAYWMLVPDVLGNLAEIWPIPASRVRPIPDRRKYIRAYAYTPRNSGRPIILARRNVCFFRRPNIFSYHRGLSPISAYRLAMENDYEAAKWNKDAYHHGMTLDGTISVPQETGLVQFEQIKADIREQLSERQVRYMIVRAGEMVVADRGISPRDAEYLQSREFNRDEIDRVYGFPGGFWNMLATRANSSTAKATVIESAVWPAATLWAGAITGQIIRPYYGEGLVGQFEDIRIRDRLMQVQERRTYWQVKTVNEAREELGDEPLPDGDPRGGLLVPEATRSQGQQQGSRFGTEEETTPEIKSLVDGKRDLRKWRSIELRRLKAGEPPGYDFESDTIPDYVKSALVDDLTGAKSEEEVRAAFAAGFLAISSARPDPLGGFTLDWQGYP